jgi:hypothetical protein
MSRLSEISTYKNTILTKLIENDNIVKAIGNINADFLDTSFTGNPRELLFKNIYPFPFVPDTEDEQKCYITMKFKYKPNGNMYKLGKISIYVFAHQDILKTSYPWLRTDFIINEIDKLFNETRELGIGELQFGGMEDMKFSQVHSGICIDYVNLSFN